MANRIACLMNSIDSKALRAPYGLHWKQPANINYLSGSQGNESLEMVAFIFYDVSLGATVSIAPRSLGPQ